MQDHHSYTRYKRPVRMIGDYTSHDLAPISGPASTQQWRNVDAKVVVERRAGRFGDVWYLLYVRDENKR